MGLRDSLEAKAKKWALDKANELLGDKDAAPAAAATPPPPPPAPVDRQADVEAQAAVGEQLVRRLVPGLGQWADRQQAQLAHEESAEAARRRAAVAALPRAEVSITLSGAVEAHWRGELPARVEVTTPPETPEPFQVRDPFVGKPSLVVTLTPFDHQQPQLGPKPLSAWKVTVPDYRGDATYDLVDLIRQRTAAGFDAPYDDTWIDLGGDDDTDYECYVYAEAGPSSVTVSDQGRTVSAALSLAGTIGTVVGTLEIRLPPD